QRRIAADHRERPDRLRIAIAIEARRRERAAEVDQRVDRRLVLLARQRGSRAERTRARRLATLQTFRRAQERRWNLCVVDGDGFLAGARDGRARSSVGATAEYCERESDNPLVSHVSSVTRLNTAVAQSADMPLAIEC